MSRGANAPGILSIGERKSMREDKVEQKYISILKKWMVIKE